MVELANNKNHMVIKRDGREEPFNYEKLWKVLLWGCNDDEILAQSILEAIDIKIYNRIQIVILYDEILDTISNLTSRITPEYDEVYKRLYLLKMYKELYGINRQAYPSYKLVLQKLIKENIIIDVLNILDEDEIEKLDNAIVPERDYLSTGLGLKTYFSKNSFKIKGKPVELMQHGIMRLAVQAFLYEPKRTRTKLIIKRYNHMSLFAYTEATPKWLNSLTPKAQMASCCLHQMDDNLKSINQTVSNIGIYSKYGGGNAVDVSSLRSHGATIGKMGKASGPIPFIKLVESSINAYNQMGSRPGACVVTFPWWHADVQDILQLKDEGGVESARARNLQYSVKINRLFLERIKTNENISLFDPKEAKKLLTLYGDEFDTEYLRLEREIKSAKVLPAREVAYEIAKIRAETGNLYIFFNENANETSPFKEPITQSNLCTEIFLPTKSAKLKDESLVYNYSKDEFNTTTESDAGLLALCNLSSVNIYYWMNSTRKQKQEIAIDLLRASDNLIDYQYYPVKDGEMFNRNYRAIGIGQNNLAYYFASKNIKFSSEEAKAEMKNISISMYEIFTQASEDLALERGNFPFYNKCKLNRPSRFSTIFSIAPTASSSLMIGATEGIEPVVNLINEKTGTYSAKQLVPGLREFGSNYELAFDIPTKALYDLAAIRQTFMLDQGQSINTYMSKVDSAYEIIGNIIYAESIGLKSLYYLQSRNSTVEVCESCSS